ncbi:hypothetical protein [Halarsenatibacter silvermanii]|uniref:SIR2-like domain-containing protein n=1 Tax=Halarsenatibacter silvermanii TaxID=321763 RepID=A0A1G9RBB5_9FIRM|nr:hypothetical protein [Halarsenatibacter silvermanii]SDM20380.1 hypothetical protein SAMN04488692_12122 [Halarsenatibacter silvermanii]
MKKSVWILGAGASKGHSNENFPSINEFFLKAKNENFLISNEGFSDLKKYINKNFGVNISDGVKLDIEKVMTAINIDMRRNKNLKFQNIKKSLLRLIRKVLNISTKASPENCSEYHDLKEVLKRNDYNDTVITFNWDLLLDNIWDRKKILKQVENNNTSDMPDNYYRRFILGESGYYLSTFGGLSVDPPYRNYNNKSGSYLKLHGSIDWLYCQNESCVRYSTVIPTLDYHEPPYYCSECHEKMEYLIIPPVLNKDFNHYPFIRKMWNKAAKEIQSVDELIIWGYSLPPTDFYSEWLIRQSRGSLEKLILINPDIDLKSFRKKFKSIFKNEENEVEFDYYKELPKYIES